jgi:hypothetical protein
MHMDLEIWYLQHTLDRNAHHLNKHMIDMVQKYMRGDKYNPNGIETYIKLGSLVYKHKHCKGILPKAN